jgi:hypothetical protein
VAQKYYKKKRKLYIYQTIIQSILMYGAEVWQIPTREINKILSTEMDVLKKPARKSRTERIKNEHRKEIMGVKQKPDIIERKMALMGEDRGVHRVLVEKPEGKRPLWRPRVRLSVTK